MAGNKNSGRRGGLTKSNAEYRLETIDECWKQIRAAINDQTLDREFRLELAAKHTVKSIPTELAGGFTAQVTHMPAIQKEIPDVSGEANNTNRIAEYLIGSPPPSQDT